MIQMRPKGGRKVGDGGLGIREVGGSRKWREEGIFVTMYFYLFNFLLNRLLPLSIAGNLLFGA